MAGKLIITLTGIAIVAGVGIYAVMVNKSSSSTVKYAVTMTPAPQEQPKAPVLPDISGFTVENYAAKAPAYKEGKVLIRRMKGLYGLKEFLESDGRIQGARLAQMKVVPDALYIQEGDYDWPHLYEAVQALDPQVILKEGNTYTLRLPLLVEKGASLTIDGKDVEELRLSKERGVMLANTGQLFIINTKVTGWSEEDKKPTLYVDSKKFRPFIVSWSGAQMHLLGSTFNALGYNKGKSYGISYSHCETCYAADKSISRATGTLIGNKFYDMYYGFYCYEADDVAIIGNYYEDNIVYAIDPHDRSRRLIIAKNETVGAKKKHGIIVSREVNDSWIFDNYTHHNHGSGIMIDRSSVNNVIANNVSEYNGQDGLTFFESQDNITWNNKFLYNGRNGIKIRNSWNIRMYNDTIIENGGAPVDVYTADITGQETRDFDLDPYTQKASAELHGALIKTYQPGVFKLGQIDYLHFSRLFITPALTQIFMGNTIPHNTAVVGSLRKEDRMIKVTPSGKDAPEGKLLGTVESIE